MTVAFTAWFFIQREPHYQGRPLTGWLKDVPFSSEQNEKQRQAVNAVQSLGSKAIPFLIRLVEARDSELKIRANRLLQKQKLIRFQFRTSHFQRYLGRRGLWALGPAAAPAISVLEHQFMSPLPERGWEAERQEIGRVLVAIGPPAFPTLERILANRNPEIRIAVISGFRECTNHLQSAAPILARVVEIEPHDGLKIWAAITLAKTGQYRELVVPTLLSGLNYQENDTRAQSAQSLLNYPGVAAEHIEAIRNLAQDRDVIARNSAEDVLRKLGVTTSGKSETNVKK